MQTNLTKCLSGSKEDVKYIQANIKNSLSRDKQGKSAKCTSLVSARSRNTVSPSKRSDFNIRC